MSTFVVSAPAPMRFAVLAPQPLTFYLHAPYGRQAMRTNLSVGESQGLIAGDSFEITLSVPLIPSGRTVTKAWLTIKEVATDPDPGVIQLVIDSDLSADGQITADGSTESLAGLLFLFTPVNTALLTPGVIYPFDIQLQYDDLTIWTLGKGTISAGQGVTEAVS